MRQIVNEGPILRQRGGLFQEWCSRNSYANASITVRRDHELITRKWHKGMYGPGMSQDVGDLTFSNIAGKGEPFLPRGRRPC